MQQEYKIIKNKLREFRNLPDKISQWELSLKSDVRQSRISLIENCLVKPTMREKIKLSLALNKKIEDVFPEIKKHERD